MKAEWLEEESEHAEEGVRERVEEGRGRRVGGAELSGLEGAVETLR